uniref:Uncharacterized protein n=1 Tax=Nelumbo nucifera TaxID=4432 RepID=A0A822ZPI2_NELNU|nr:TPA_asm: hypothetical protein HUJ06_003056 [Nelumbo nucifera]
MGARHEVLISLDGVRDKNLMQLKKLNTALFPVRYNDKYYADALASGEFTKLGMKYCYGFLFSFLFPFCFPIPTVIIYVAKILSFSVLCLLGSKL